MKTISDFKRILQVGTELYTVYHCASKRDQDGKVLRTPDGQVVYEDQDMGLAKVSKVLATKFAVGRTRTDGSVVDSWCYYPKASESVVSDNSVTIFEECDRRGRIPVLTYSLKVTK